MNEKNDTTFGNEYRKQIEQLNKENNRLRELVRDIHWMGLSAEREAGVFRIEVSLALRDRLKKEVER